MTPRSTGALSTALAFALLGLAACESDVVQPGVYGVLDASVSSTSSRSDTGTSQSADAMASIAEGNTPSSPVCDMNGRWLVA